MSRIRCLLMIAVCSVALSLPPMAASAAPPKDKLNVLMIAVDDLRPELGCYGDEHIISPNLDRLADDGVLFTSAYCQMAVCSPSRTSLMTGLRPDSTQIFDLVTHFRDTVPDVITLGQHFKNNGYLSVGMGKIFHGGLNDVKTWSVPYWQNPPTAKGYNNPETLQYMQQRREEGKAKGLTGKDLSHYALGPPAEGEDVPDERYVDGATAAHAIDTIKELAQQDKPFFLAVGFLKPHLPFNSPKKYWDLYDRNTIKVPDFKQWPNGAPSFAGSNWGELRNYKDVPKSGLLTDEQAKKLRHGYYASVSFTDANIGKVLDELKRQGLDENTVVVVWGDHGWKLGDYGAWCKHTNFEIDTHVPLIVRMPGAKGNGQKSDALVEFVDIYPTLADLAGLDLPGHLEGTSFAPVLENPGLNWKTAAFSQYPRKSGNTSIMGYTCRSGDWRLTRWVKRNDPTEEVAVELYDISETDTPQQNLADNPEYKEVLEKMLKINRAGWPAARPLNW